MARSEQWQEGRRNGLKYAISFLHDRANQMNDERARAVLHSAAYALGGDAKNAVIPAARDHSQGGEK